MSKKYDLKNKLFPNLDHYLKSNNLHSETGPRKKQKIKNTKNKKMKNEKMKKIKKRKNKNEKIKMKK